MSDKWHRLTDWFGEKKESFTDWFKDNGVLYALGGAALAGLIGTSVYLKVSDYVASAGISIAISSLISATAGAALDKFSDIKGYDGAIGGAKFGALGGVLCGPISYALFNYWENNEILHWFDNLSGAADVFAKGAIGGVAGPLVAFLLFVKYVTMVEK